MSNANCNINRTSSQIHSRSIIAPMYRSGRLIAVKQPTPAVAIPQTYNYSNTRLYDPVTGHYYKNTLYNSIQSLPVYNETAATVITVPSNACNTNKSCNSRNSCNSRISCNCATKNFCKCDCVDRCRVNSGDCHDCDGCGGCNKIYYSKLHCDSNCKCNFFKNKINYVDCSSDYDSSACTSDSSDSCDIAPVYSKRVCDSKVKCCKTKNGVECRVEKKCKYNVDSESTLYSETQIIECKNKRKKECKNSCVCFKTCACCNNCEDNCDGSCCKRCKCHGNRHGHGKCKNKLCNECYEIEYM